MNDQMNDQMIRSSEEYLESLRGRNLDIYLFGEKVKETAGSSSDPSIDYCCR